NGFRSGPCRATISVNQALGAGNVLTTSGAYTTIKSYDKPKVPPMDSQTRIQACKILIYMLFINVFGAIFLCKTAIRSGFYCDNT
ncbi:MAG: hypothetical protein AB7P34_13820, partial [Vicinamibacterales bacterium]